MLKILILSYVISLAYGADHNVFKNCSEVEFCSTLRNQILDADAQFAADTAAFQLSNDIIRIPLQNANGEVLFLEVSLLIGATIRLKVLEADHTRYELIDVLDGEPITVGFEDVVVQENSISFAAGDDPESYRFVVVNGPPFRVEFYFQSDLRVVFNADRLVMQNTDTSKAFTFGVEFPESSYLYGLFHHAYKLVLGDTVSNSDPFRVRNTDTVYYEANSPMALYGNIPVIYGNTGTATSGIFLHNAAQLWVDTSYSGDSPSTYFMAESGTLDLFVMLGPETQDVVRQYTALTGRAHMPQLWTLGYHQNRFTYASQEEVKEVAALMDQHDIPVDVIFLDDGHTNGNRYFEWNPLNFTDPVEMQNNISSIGKKLIAVSDPHIKVADDYPVYSGAKENYFIRWENGTNYEGNSWPGASSWLDFLNPEVRDYYASWYSYDKFVGSTETIGGIWNDMNEPSVFDDDREWSVPFETIHIGNVPHRDVHNIYGLLHTKSTHHGLMQRDNGTKRPFILTRSHFAGSQRYAAMWTGDNTATWPFLILSYSECMTSNILGLVFCGADVAGFLDDPDDELYQRWYQAAAWLPYFRGHSNKGTKRREPYLFDEDIQNVVRNAIKLRYKHLPVFYTLFYEHTLYGYPLVRPLFYTYPTYFEYDDHMLIGTDILVRPVMEPGVTEVTVTLPSNFNSDIWYRVDDDSWQWYSGPIEVNTTVDINASPLYYRGGSIIARKDTERPSTALMINDPYTLYVNLDGANVAEGRLYVDDYTSFEYLTSKSYLYVELSYIAESAGIRITNLDRTSDSSDINVSIRAIIIHSADGSEVQEYSTTKDGTPPHQS